MEIAAVMVQVDHATGSSGVVIDADGDMWLSDRVDRIGGSRLDDFRPRQVGLDDDRTLVGGRLPSGAVAAIVIDDSGERRAATGGTGAWALVLERWLRGAINPVYFRDAAGVPVPPPLPPEWERSPVTDSDEPCPACASAAWDVVVPADRSRGTVGGDRPATVIVCRVCGHEEQMGAVMRFPPHEELDPAVVRAHEAEAEERRRLTNAMTLDAVTFPVYGVAGLPGQISGSGSHGDEVTSVTVSHDGDDEPGRPRLHVQTALTEQLRPRGEHALVTEALTDWLWGPLEWPGESDAAFVLALRAQQRACERVAAGALETERVITVDDHPTPFVYREAGDRWAAVGRTGPVTITVTGAGIDLADIRLAVPEPLTSLI